MSRADAGVVRAASFLAWLRDDDLVERVATETDEPVESAAIDAFLAKGAGDGSSGDSAYDRPQSPDRPDAAAAATVGSAGDSPSEADVRCQHCGAQNPESVRYCGDCVSRL